MKIIFNKPKQQRITKAIKYLYKANGLSKNKPYRHRRPLWIEPVGSGWWYSLTKKQWQQGYNSKDRMTTSFYGMGEEDVYSLKAAIRKISKWDLPKGTKVRISLPLVGHDIYITK